jgi:xanthine dehydrogenase iron-sulfur cluster and FAD-binding subunit A
MKAMAVTIPTMVKQMMARLASIRVCMLGSVGGGMGAEAPVGD